MKKIIASMLTVSGFVSFLVAFMSAYYAIISFIERSKYGPGLLFADVEMFTIITLFFIIIGFLCLLISNRIKKSLQQKD